MSHRSIMTATDTSETTPTSGIDKIQRKIGVVHGSDNPTFKVTKLSDGNIPPPPYIENNGPTNEMHASRSRSRTSSETESSVPVAYTVPKDLSEGLPNPVFTYTPTNPDGDDHNYTDSLNKDSVGIYNNNTTIPGFPTVIHDKNSCNEKDVSDFVDTEKGPPGIIGQTNKNEAKPEYKGIKKYLGLLLTLSASFFFSVVILFVKILKDYNFDAYGASFWRYTGTIIPTIPLLIYFECGPGVKKQASVFHSVWPVWKNDNWKTWIGLLSRGLIGSTSVILRYYALRYLTIGDTSVITYSTPVLVTVLAHFFLGEKCGVFPIIVAFVTLCGVVIVTRPPILTGKTEFDSNMLIGTGFACGSLFCSALIVIITRKIRAVHFTVMTLVFGIIGVAQALILIYFLGEFNLPTEWFDSMLIAGVAVLSWLGQMAIVLALKFEQAGPVALIRSCDVLFGFFFQYVFLHVSPDIFSGAGAVIVLTGVLSTGFRKWLNTLPQDDNRRKRWRFVLA